MFGWFAHSSTSSGRARLRLEPLEDRTVPSADPLEPPPSEPPLPTEPTVAPPPAEPPSAPAPEAPVWDSWTEADWEAFWLDLYDAYDSAVGDITEENESEFADDEVPASEAAPAFTPPAWFNDAKLYSATAEGVTLQKWSELFGTAHARTFDVFDTLDANADSKITLAELEAASTGTAAQKLAVADANWAYAKVTTTMLDHERIALLRDSELVPEGATGITAARWQTVFGDSTEMADFFAALDTDGNGTITHADIIALGSTGRKTDYDTIWTAEYVAAVSGLGVPANPNTATQGTGAVLGATVNHLRYIQRWTFVSEGNTVTYAIRNPQYLGNAAYRRLVDAYAEHVAKLEPAALTATEWAAWKTESARFYTARNDIFRNTVNAADRYVVGFTGADGKDHVLGTTSSYGKREIEDMMVALNRSPTAVRALATLSALGNVAQAGFGALMIGGSESTFGLSAVPGWFVFSRGVEGAATDAATIVSGEVQLRPSIIAVREVARAFMSTKDAEHVALGFDLALSIADLILARRANLPSSPGATGPAFQLATSAGSTQRVGVKQVSSIAIDARAADRLKELLGAGKIAGAGNIWFMAVARDSTDPLAAQPSTGGGSGATGTPSPAVTGNAPSQAVFRADLEAHLVLRDRSVARASGIGGAHNLVEFNKAAEAEGIKIIKRTAHPTLPGVEKIEYQIPALDLAGKPTGKFRTKGYEKTVYDPTKISDADMIRWGKEAAEEAASRGALTREWTGTAANGVKFRGYLDNAGEVRSFFFDF